MGDSFVGGFRSMVAYRDTAFVPTERPWALALPSRLRAPVQGRTIRPERTSEITVCPRRPPAAPPLSSPAERGCRMGPESLAWEKPPEVLTHGDVCLRDRWRDVIAGQGHHRRQHRAPAQEPRPGGQHPQAR